MIGSRCGAWKRCRNIMTLLGDCPWAVMRLNFLIATTCTWLAASPQAWSITAIHPQSQIAGPWNLSFFGSASEPAQALTWFPSRGTDSEDKIGKTHFPNVLSQVSPSKGYYYVLEESIWEGTKVTSRWLHKTGPWFSLISKGKIYDACTGVYCHHTHPRTEEYRSSSPSLIVTSHLNGGAYCEIWVKFSISTLRIYKISIYFHASWSCYNHILYNKIPVLQGVLVISWNFIVGFKILSIEISIVCCSVLCWKIEKLEVGWILVRSLAQFERSTI